VLEKPGTPKGNRTPVCAVKGRSMSNDVTKEVRQGRSGIIWTSKLPGARCAAFGSSPMEQHSTNY
jgi:hypothetical protein